MKFFAICLLGLNLMAHAQQLPVGIWQTFDDSTKTPKSTIQIAVKGGLLIGTIQAIQHKDAGPDERCIQCKDDRKNKPLIGLEIIRSPLSSTNQNKWVGGKVLDPETGKEFDLILELSSDAQKLKVRGSWGPFWETQVWHRLQ